MVEVRDRKGGEVMIAILTFLFGVSADDIVWGTQSTVEILD